jgi:hypothetical protein
VVGPEIDVISFCWLAMRVWVVLAVVKLVQLPNASSDQLSLAAGVPAIVSGTVWPLEIDSVPRAKAVNCPRLS